MKRGREGHMLNTKRALVIVLIVLTVVPHMVFDYVEGYPSLPESAINNLDSIADEEVQADPEGGHHPRSEDHTVIVNLAPEGEYNLDGHYLCNIEKIYTDCYVKEKRFIIFLVNSFGSTLI
jgi:hypothetical protein